MRLLSLVFLGALSFWACSGEYFPDVEIEVDEVPESSALEPLSFERLSSELASSSCSSTPQGTSSPFSSSSESSTLLGLPPAGFYSTLTLDEPQATQGGIVSCTFNGAEPVEIAAPASYAREIQKNTVVRCYEFLNSEIVAKQTETYFIGEKVTMPVVALSVPAIFFIGHVSASPCKPDPCKSAAFWEDVEFPVHVEYFAEGSASKQKAFEIDAGISIMGGWSRNQVKKSVSVVMRKEYQDGRLKYPLFETRPEAKKFKAFILRNNGNRFVSDYIADPMAVSLLEGTTVDYQRSRQVVVFYNGTYYGIHDMREKLNEHFVETNYGIDSKEVDFIKHIDKTINVANGSSVSYEEMLNFAAAADFSDMSGTALEQISKMLDLYNYADYMAAEIYYHNGDWPNNNVRAWRSPEHPWKFMVYDVDHGFGWKWGVDDPKGDKFNDGTNMFTWIKQGGGNKPCKESGCFANLYIKLIQNEDFKRMFINRSAVMWKNYLNSARVTKIVDQMVSTIPESEKKRDVEKFHQDEMYYPDGFDWKGTNLKSWASERDGKVLSEYKSEFDLGEMVSVTIEAQGSGAVLMDGMNLPSSSYTGEFFSGNKMELTAVPSNGSIFEKWSDGSTDNPHIVTITGGLSITATFK